MKIESISSIFWIHNTKQLIWPPLPAVRWLEVIINTASYPTVQSLGFMLMVIAQDRDVITSDTSMSSDLFYFYLFICFVNSDKKLGNWEEKIHQVNQSFGWFICSSSIKPTALVALPGHGLIVSQGPNARTEIGTWVVYLLDSMNPLAGMLRLIKVQLFIHSSTIFLEHLLCGSHSADDEQERSIPGI